MRFIPSSVSSFLIYSHATLKFMPARLMFLSRRSRHWISMVRMTLLPITPYSNGNFCFALRSIPLSTVMVYCHRSLSSSLRSRAFLLGNCSLFPWVCFFGVSYGRFGRVATSGLPDLSSDCEMLNAMLGLAARDCAKSCVRGILNVCSVIVLS